MAEPTSTAACTILKLTYFEDTVHCHATEFVWKLYRVKSASRWTHVKYPMLWTGDTRCLVAVPVRGKSSFRIAMFQLGFIVTDVSPELEPSDLATCSVDIVPGDRLPYKPVLKQ